MAVLEFEFGLTKDVKIASSNEQINESKNYTETFAESQSQAETKPSKRKIPPWMGGSANVGVKKQKSSIFK